MYSLVPPKRFEQDMTWLRAGIAMRTAIDIALHRVGLLPAARQGLPTALLHPMIRTWLLCFIADRSLSVQLGKPNGRQWEDEVWQYVSFLRSPDQPNQMPDIDDVVVAYLAVSWTSRTRLMVSGMGVDPISSGRRVSLTRASGNSIWRQPRRHL